MDKLVLKNNYGILKWNNSNRKRYIELGYIFTKNGEEFLIELNHATPYY